jgi:hypothetical protein
MFNSHGNRGSTVDSGIVEPFEVLGKWMSRYAMWQLELAPQLFIAKGCKLCPSEIKYDSEEEKWDYESDIEDDPNDCTYSVSSGASDVDSESDLDDFSEEDAALCVYNSADDVDATRYCFRKRKHDYV